MIEDLKIAAEWMDVNWKLYENKEIYLWTRLNQWTTLFNPHKETGRYYLVEMLRKLDKEQWAMYNTLMGVHYRHSQSLSGFDRWLSEASSDISFKCIMEVIKTAKP